MLDKTTGLSSLGLGCDPRLQRLGEVPGGHWECPSATGSSATGCATRSWLMASRMGMVFYGGYLIQFNVNFTRVSTYKQVSTHVRGVMLRALLEGETDHEKEQLQVWCRSFAIGTWGWDDQGHRDTQGDPKPKETAGGANKVTQSGSTYGSEQLCWLLLGFKKSMDFGLVTSS